MGFFSRLNEMVDKAWNAGHNAIHAGEAKVSAGVDEAWNAGHNAIHEGTARADTAMAERLSKGAQSMRENAAIARGGETVHHVSKPVATPSVGGKAPKFREA